MASVNPAAVQVLKQQFPAVDEATINDILYNQCSGDTNAAIVILVKIQEFNASMQTNNASAAAQAAPLKAIAQQPVTTHAVEGATTAPVIIQQIPAQQMIPIQVATSSSYDINCTLLQQKYPHWNLNLEPNTGCRCCSADKCPCCMDCCPSCYLVPDQYENGLYPIDLKIKNIAFILFISMTFYGEIELLVLDSGHHGYYLPVVGLCFMLIGALSSYASSSRDPSTINKIITACFYLGGALYLAGYLVYTFAIEPYDVCDDGSVCDCNYWYDGYGRDNGCDCGDMFGHNQCLDSWESDWRYHFHRMPQFFFVRGAFIFYHCILMGLHYASPFGKCKRIALIQWDALMFGVFSALVLSASVPHWIWMVAFSGMSHFWLAIVSFSNVCTAQEWTNKGGCTGFSATGALMLIFFISEVIAAFGVLLDMEIHADYEIDPEIFGTAFFFWAFADFVFGALQFGIFLRMIHPTFVTMCCSKPQQDFTVAI